MKYIALLQYTDLYHLISSYTYTHIYTYTYTYTFLPSPLVDDIPWPRCVVISTVALVAWSWWVRGDHGPIQEILAPADDANHGAALRGDQRLPGDRGCNQAGGV